MTNQLSIPQTQTSIANVSDADFADLAKGSSFLGRLQLYSKGSAINKRLIAPGEFGVPETGETITNLSDSVTIIPLARRAKAVDMSDKDAVITSYSPTSDEFNHIKTKAEQPNSNCMYGIEFLVWVPAIARFLSFFCGTKTMRAEAGKIFPFLPVFGEGEDARPARPLTMTSRVIEAKDYSWHGVTIKESTQSISKFPTDKQMIDELNKFNNPKVEAIEKVDEATTQQRRAR